MQLFRIKLKQEAANQNQLTLAEIFNGQPVSKATVTASLPAEKEKTAEAEVVKTKPESEVVKKGEIKTPGTHITPKKMPDKETVKPATKPETQPVAAEQKNGVIYKVQVLPSTSQIKAGEMVINGSTYRISVYTYLGAVRYTVGEFGTLGPATALQKLCRQSGNSQAFVAAFKNGSRSLDPNLFK